MISVIIPVYNYGQLIKDTALRLVNFFKNQPEPYEVIFVNDGSSDDTAKYLGEIAGQEPNIKVINLQHNQGKGVAVKEGILASQGDYVIFTDADLPYDLRSVNSFANKIKNGYDVVLGSRNFLNSGQVLHYGFFRKVASYIFAKLANTVILGNTSTTPLCGFKGFSRQSARVIFSRTIMAGFCFDVEVICLARKLKYKITEEPVTLVSNAETTISFKRGCSIFFDLFKFCVKVILKRNK